MKTKKMLGKLLKQKRGMVGIEAAIVLIAFVIVAAAFSFMVVNMGLFSAQRGRETIQQGVSEASSPLTLDGSIQLLASSATPSMVYAFVVPIKTLGVRYVPMAAAKSEVTLRIEQHTAIADVYHGINTVDPTLKTLDELQLLVTGDNTAELFIGNSDLDSSLDYDEKGFLVFQLGSGDEAAQRDHVFVEIRPEKGAPLTLEFIIPPQLTEGWHTIGS